MEGNQQINSPLKEDSPKANEITIMIMGNIGKIRSFTVSRRVLLWSSILLLIYILLSLFIIVRFIDVRYRFSMQSEMVKNFKERYNGMEKDLLKAQQRATNLEAYIESTKQKKEDVGTVEVQGAADASADKPAVKTDEKAGGQTTKSVEIEGLDIRRMDSVVVVDFRLINMTSGDGAVEGYMHIIVSDKNNNFPSVWNAPSRDVRNGLPSEFRSGERFIIQRFKQYHREFTSDGSSGAPASIRILAYDPSGNLILMREYEVKDAL